MVGLLEGGLLGLEWGEFGVVLCNQIVKRCCDGC